MFNRIHVGVLCTLLCGVAEAESLLDIYQMAVHNDFELKVAKSAYLVEKQSKYIARSRLLPQLTLQGTLGKSGSKIDTISSNPFSIQGELTSESDSKGYSISLTQTVFDASSYLTYEQTVLVDERSILELKNIEQKLILRVADTYLQTLKAQEDYEISVETQDAFERQLKYAERKRLAGIARVAEVNEARSSYYSASASVVSAKNLLNVLLESLTVLTGQQHKTLTQSLPKKMSPSAPVPSDIKHWVKSAYEHNLDIKVARYREKEAHKAYKAQKAKHLPTVSAQLNFTDDVNNNRYNYAIPDKVFQDSWNASISLTVPLYSGGLIKAESREAFHRRNFQKHTYNQVRREVEQSIHSSYLDILSGLASLEARKVAVESGQKSLDSSELDYISGLNDLRDLSAAQRLLFSDKLQYNDAVYSYFVSGLRLKEAAGVISFVDLEILNQFLDD
ncbi:MAG: outer membrane protein [Bacteroidia bacterium]|jgi:outer membrane protein